MPAHDHAHHDHGAPHQQGSFWSSRAFLVFLGFAAISVVMLWKEHSAHILGVLPYLFLLACPLMHVFMHGGHGGHGGGHGEGPTDTRGGTGSWDSTKGDNP